MKQFMLAGVSSGVGKTTVTLALLKALMQKGFTVQAYKVGPDYIDTAYHTRITNRPSRNLDSFMIPDKETLEWSYYRWHDDCDISVVEGAMGLFDGLESDKDFASSADVAKKLNIPVILVIDGKATSTSAAAMVHGFNSFDPDLDIAGVIINRVASESHFQLIKKAIERYTDVKVIGYFPKNIDVELPSRHLGLVPDHEMANLDKQFELLGTIAQDCIAIDDLLSEKSSAKKTIISPFKTTSFAPLTIAYAQDEAFHFYYQDNLDLLEEFGVTLKTFSPLKSEKLPEADAYYFGGGFPELFAKELMANESFRVSVLKAHQDKKTIYAECGGLMYLGKQLEVDDVIYDMVGIFDGISKMTSRLKRFGYCYATAKRDTLFGSKGTTIRGHEFHHSIFETVEETAFDLEKRRGVEVVSSWQGGYQKDNTLASYLHIHFYQNQDLVKNWLSFIKGVK